MGFTHLDSNVIQAFEEAKIDAEQHGQTFVNSVRLFKAAIKIVGLPANNLIDLSDGIKSILHKYSVNLKDIGIAANELWPAIDGSSAGFEPVEDPDIINIRNSLISEAESTKQTQNMYNLFSALFRDENYALFKCLQKVSDNHQKEFEEASKIEQDKTKVPACGFDVHSLYADIKRFLSSKVSWDISALETDNMQKYIENLNTKFSKEDSATAPKLIGMEDEMTALQVALAGRDVKSCMLVGEAGVGKSSIVYNLVRRIIRGEVPEFLKNVVIYELHLSNILSGASFVGQYEERMTNILNAVKKLNNVILFIDEIHTAGKQATSMNAFDLIKPYLSRGDIWMIGATTTSEFNEFVNEDKAIARRFTKVLVNEPNLETTKEILKGVRDTDNAFFNKESSDDIIDSALKYSQEYSLELANPAKAINVLDGAYAYAKVKHPNDNKVTQDDIRGAIELKYNIHIYPDRVEKTRNYLKSELFGQDQAIDTVVDKLQMIDMNIRGDDTPAGALLLVGPTGTGKSELSKLVAKSFYGSDDCLIQLSGSELQTEEDITRIMGSAPSFVGYQNVSGFLQKIQQHPNAILLVDEIEKAHQAIYRVFINMLTDGYMTSSGGDKISFRNILVLFTTNLGYGRSAFEGSGIMAVKRTAQAANLEIKKYFSPEFLGRIDNIVQFNRLDNSVIENIIEKFRKRYVEKSQRNIKFSKKDIEDIKKNSDIENYGARNVAHEVAQKFFELAKKEVR